jgi:ceramide glucosyltransferase
MNSSLAVYFLLGVAALPFIYYLIALYSSWRFFGQPPERTGKTPPVSVLKPIRGVDPEAYENFASLCRQDYPEYEILFCVDRRDDPVVSVIDRLSSEFPLRNIRVLFGSGSTAPNDKVAKLRRLVDEAQNEVLVIGDSDVRVAPDYLRSVVGPLADPAVGAVTCFYLPTDDQRFAASLQAVGMVSDFYAGILVAWQLDGVKFALGPTIATTRARLADFGGFAAIESRPGDDLLVGRLIADHGHEVKLIPYTVLKLAGYHTFGELLEKRMRWMVVMRHMRPWGHFGLLLTQGLPWSLAAIAIHPSAKIALAYLATYLLLRIALTWSIGIRGLKRSRLWKEMSLIMVWDAVAFAIWGASFVRKKLRWRDADYYIRDGVLCPEPSSPTES